MEQEIYVDGQSFTLLRYRCFLYKGRRFTVFIHPEECDETGDPILYILEGSDGRYVVPAKEDREMLFELLAPLLSNEAPFGAPVEDIFWLPWDE